MSVDQYALAQMTALSVLLGIFLELLFELLRFAGGIFFPRFIRDKYTENDDVIAIIWFNIRDIVFLLCCGIAFSVFVYYTNDGNVRFTAVVGALVGFVACYFTVGRIIRRLSVFMLNMICKLLNILLCPLRAAVKYLIGCGANCISWMSASARKNYTYKEMKKVSSLKYRGIP